MSVLGTFTICCTRNNFHSTYLNMYAAFRSKRFPIGLNGRVKGKNYRQVKRGKLEPTASLWCWQSTNLSYHLPLHPTPQDRTSVEKGNNKYRSILVLIKHKQRLNNNILLSSPKFTQCQVSFEKKKLIFLRRLAFPVCSFYFVMFAQQKYRTR